MYPKVISFTFLVLLLMFTATAGAAVLDVNGQPDPTDSRMSLWLKSADGIAVDASNRLEGWEDQSQNAFLGDTTPDQPVLITENVGGQNYAVVYMGDDNGKVSIADEGSNDKLDIETSDFYQFYVGRGENYEATLYSQKGGGSSADEAYRLYQCCATPGEIRVRFGTGCATEECKAGTLIPGSVTHPVSATYGLTTAALDVNNVTGIATAKGWYYDGGYYNGNPLDWVPGAAGAADDVLDINDGINTENSWYMGGASIAGRALYTLEFLIYKGELTTTEREDIEGYLVDKYLSIPAAQPKAINPAVGEQNVSIHPILSWTSGAGASNHEVYFGTSSPPPYVKTQSANTFDPCELQLEQTYYWKIKEVETVTSGDIWKFTVASYLLVDGMEDYNDVNTASPDRMFDTWVDGRGIGANGAQVGYETTPVSEQTIVYVGGHSMPYMYGNGTATSSEATAAIANLPVGSDWTAGNVTTLSLWFQGKATNDPCDIDEMYVKVNGVKAVYGGDMQAVTEDSWQEWNIELAGFGIDLTNVTSISIGFEHSVNPSSEALGTIYFDHITLQPARCLFPPEMDFNGDCVVNFEDFADIAGTWLESGIM